MPQTEVPLYNQFIKRICVFLVLSAVFECITAGAAIDYSTGRLVSKLNRRNHDYSDVVSDVSDGVPRPNGQSADTIGDSIKPQMLEAGRASQRGGEILVPKTFPMSPEEPTCEQLRAMWIFSKRQSRAAEMTNEIPTYRDPFAYNIWDPYYSTTRSVGAVRMLPHFGDRLPVFGRVVNREPLLPRVPVGQSRILNGDLNQMSRIYGAEAKPPISGLVRRPISSYRSISAGNIDSYKNAANPNTVPIQGSFQKLKELIWTERAKELSQQRRAEELAAKAAVLKEIANGQLIHSALPYKSPLLSESALMDENRTPDREDSYQQDRVSIVTSQSTDNKKNKVNNKINSRNGKSSASVNRKDPKSMQSSIFSENRAAAPRYTFAQDASSEMGDKFESGNLGYMKTFPLRPSHFRERNRSLFKQNAGSDYFQRNIRFNRNFKYGISNANSHRNFMNPLVYTVDPNESFLKNGNIGDPLSLNGNGKTLGDYYADNDGYLQNSDDEDDIDDVDSDAGNAFRNAQFKIKPMFMFDRRVQY